MGFVQKNSKSIFSESKLDFSHVDRDLDSESYLFVYFEYLKHLFFDPSEFLSIISFTKDLFKFFVISIRGRKIPFILFNDKNLIPLYNKEISFVHGSILKVQNPNSSTNIEFFATTFESLPKNFYQMVHSLKLSVHKEVSVFVK